MFNVHPLQVCLKAISTPFRFVHFVYFVVLPLLNPSPLIQAPSNKRANR